MNEYRRNRRRSAAGTIAVSDAMTGAQVGRLGNLSESGLLLIGASPMTDDALYQLSFVLSHRRTTRTVEVGAHQLWSDSASAPGQYWVGFRFIDVSHEAVDHIRAWVDAPGEHEG